MHALVPILIAANNKHEQNLPTITKTTTTDESGTMSETKAEDTERMSALEAKAVAEATATASWHHAHAVCSEFPVDPR